MKIEKLINKLNECNNLITNFKIKIVYYYLLISIKFIIKKQKI